MQTVVTSQPYFGLRRYAGGTDADFGREKTVTEYVMHTIEALREARRVLRPDGVVFWNIGDSYYGSGRGHGGRLSKLSPLCDPNPVPANGKAKSLCLIPERIVIAAQDDGWIVRDIIVWQKPNAVPESVRDRCTRCYEVLVMLVKQRNYYWNSEEAVEPSVCWQKGTWGSAEKTLQARRAKLLPPIGNTKHQQLSKATLACIPFRKDATGCSA